MVTHNGDQRLAEPIGAALERWKGDLCKRSLSFGMS
jgi:hypothetical protein